MAAAPSAAGSVPTQAPVTAGPTAPASVVQEPAAVVQEPAAPAPERPAAEPVVLASGTFVELCDTGRRRPSGLTSVVFWCDRSTWPSAARRSPL